MTLNQIANWNSRQNHLEKVYGLNTIAPTITTRVAESIGGGINSSTILICEDFEEIRNLRDLYRDNMKSKLKSELCEKLLSRGKVKEFDVIRHSYTKNRLNNGDKNMNRVESVQNNICHTLDTRCDTLGVVVKDD